MLLRTLARSAGTAAALPRRSACERRAEPLRRALLRRPLTCVRAEKEDAPEGSAAAQPVPAAPEAVAPAATPPATARGRRRAAGAPAGGPETETAGAGGSGDGSVRVALGGGGGGAGGSGSGSTGGGSGGGRSGGAGGGGSTREEPAAQPLRLFVVEASRRGRLIGAAALGDAFPQQAAAARASGQPQPISVLRKDAYGNCDTYILTLVSRPTPAVHVGITKELWRHWAMLVGDLLLLWVWPDGTAVLEPLRECASPAFVLDDSTLGCGSSSAAAVSVPLGVAEDLFGTHLARNLTGSVFIPIKRLLGPEYLDARYGPVGMLRGTSGVRGGAQWQLVGLQPWLRLVDAKPGDRLLLGVRLSGGRAKQRKAALTVDLVKAAPARRVLAGRQDGSSGDTAAAAGSGASPSRGPRLAGLALPDRDGVVHMYGKGPDGYDAAMLRNEHGPAGGVGVLEDHARRRVARPQPALVLPAGFAAGASVSMLLTERSFGPTCAVPIGVVESVLGAELARTRGASVAVRVAPDAAVPAAEKVAAGASLRAAVGRRVAWRLARLRRWLHAVEAAPGDELHLTVVQDVTPVRGVAAAAAAPSIRVRLVRAYERAPDA